MNPTLDTINKSAEIIFSALKNEGISFNSSRFKPIEEKEYDVPEKLAPFIDHTILKPEATPADVKKVCVEAIKNGFATVCVNSSNIPLVAEALVGSNVKPISVVGFPLGAMITSAKAYEASEAVRKGAREIDMVINIAALKSLDYGTVFKDIDNVVRASGGAPVKVILETSLLCEEDKIAGSIISVIAGAAFVKTSTGFGGGGATVEDIKLMRMIVGDKLGVKASGGVRSKEEAIKMIKAGANRIGTSSGAAIVSGGSGSQGY